VQELITPASLANRVRQRRTTHQGSFLIVEGASDAKFYGQLIDKACCQLLPPAQNRDKAIAALKILQQSSIEGVVAIVDKDFDELNGTLPDLPNLFFTDTHDLETMLLKSPALEKLLGEFASEEKLEKFGRDVREVILAAGCTIGYLLWVSLQDGLHLTFEGIDFPKFIDEQTLTIDEARLIEEVKKKSQKAGLKTPELQQRLHRQKAPTHDRWQVCRGHDLINILVMGFRKALGSKQSNKVTVEILERDLRLAYEQRYFQTTQLHGTIGQWERHHPAYRILPSC
jgi:Protein of unknown function (DUF4435)